MEIFDYRDWVGWPEEDVREYAHEVADFFGLPPAQADHMEAKMAERAGYWPAPKPRFGPFKMDEVMEALYRSITPGEVDLFERNRRMNAPWRQPRYEIETRPETVGSGLTRKHGRRILRETAAVRRERRKAQRRRGKHPFTGMNLQMRALAEDAMWFANCLPLDYGRWLIPPGHDKPHEGLLWYSRELLAAYYNAREQAARGNSEAAMWHAYRAGCLSTELALRMALGQTFDKYEAVGQAQRDAGRARKTIPDEARREAYWRYRSAGHKRIESGRLAAAELGLSEPSIRNAFPGARYPKE